MLLLAQRAITVKPHPDVSKVDRLGQTVKIYLLINLAVLARLLDIECVEGFFLGEVRVHVVTAFLPVGCVQARVIPDEFLAVLTLIP